MSGGRSGGRGESDFDLQFKKTFSNAKGAFDRSKLSPRPPDRPPDIIFEKYGISAFSGKKFIVVAFLDQFLCQFKLTIRKTPKMTPV